jgi:BMFP domain-containing protein YqiC
MENKRLLRMLAVAAMFALLLPENSKADIDSDARNPGMDKQESVVEQKIIKLGTAMKGWAVGFGADVEKSAIETKQAFLNDVDRFQQSKFWQYQVDGWTQGQQDLANTRESIKQLPQTLARVPGDIVTELGNFVRAVTGVKNANEEK